MKDNRSSKVIYLESSDWQRKPTKTQQKPVNFVKPDKKILRSSRNRINLLSYESKLTDKREQYDWRAQKNLDRNGRVTQKLTSVFRNYLVYVMFFIAKFCVINYAYKARELAAGIVRSFFRNCQIHPSNTFPYCQFDISIIVFFLPFDSSF